MTREIKFRAWDGKRMWFNVQDAYDYIHGAGSNNDDQIPATYFGEIADGDDGWKPMQYIGLKDKDGKEIYEGDILTDKRYKDGNTHIVKWEQFDGCMGCVATIGFQSLIGHMEIIGNIYSNPDLLSDKIK